MGEAHTFLFSGACEGEAFSEPTLQSIKGAVSQRHLTVIMPEDSGNF